MFSFIKKYAESLAGVDIYGDVGLLIFVVIFLAAVVFALKANKGYIAEMASLPLHDSSKN
jgi:hypothetical protein